MSDPGAMVGPYRVEARLSHESFAHAEVFRARDPDGTLCCIKRIHPSVAADEDFVARFVTEMELVVERLSHINLVRVYDHGQDDGPYFVMEWVDGVDLHRLLTAHGPLPADLVAYLAVEMCRALAYVHRSEWEHAEGQPVRTRGPVIHGDLSPSNILLSRQGFVKLADFGLAHVLGRTGMRTMTEARGKPMYWSPEQFADQEIGVEADLFALALVLWRSLVGSHPYAEGRPAGRLLNEWIAERTMQAATGRRSVVEAAPNAPPVLQRVVEGLLQPRERRIGSAEELFETLRPIEPLDGHARLGALVDEVLRGARLP